MQLCSSYIDRREPFLGCRNAYCPRLCSISDDVAAHAEHSRLSFLSQLLMYISTCYLISRSCQLDIQWVVYFLPPPSRLAYLWSVFLRRTRELVFLLAVTAFSQHTRFFFFPNNFSDDAVEQIFNVTLFIVHYWLGIVCVFPGAR